MSQKRIAIRQVNSRELTDRQVHRMAEILTDAVYASPWLLRWQVGSPSDAPGEDTTCAYINLFRKRDSDLFLYEEEGGHEDVLAGYMLGARFDSELIAATHMSAGIDSEKIREVLGPDAPTGPQVGDHYWAVVMIQGKTGWEDRPLDCYRSRLINEERVMTHMVRMLVGSADRHGCARQWVRTQIDQHAVRRVAGRFGYKVVGQQDVQQGATSASRVVMVKGLTDFAGSPTEVAGPWE